ncbi:MAG: UDP-N-acetyl-D-mannosamine dehydrogenase [Legionella sp.]|nr:UDP-N-acetyl-D-mannosamine dehydrogenase [Legionella sp.]
MLESRRDLKPFLKISVIGLGYIGLPTAALFASRKQTVVGVDICSKTVDIINRGEIHIVEPELDELVRSVVSEGYLRAAIKPEPADVFLIAVPTPFKENHQPNLDYIEAAVRSIAPVLKQGDLLILESTSPVGTTEKMVQWLVQMRPDLTFPQSHGEHSDIGIAYCPERVLPGRILHELVKNDRVIGGITPHCAEKAVAFYKLFVEGDCLVTHARTAEMCKLVENSFRDVNIAFANELSMLCDSLDINVWELIQLANRHPRVEILQPGPGVGGHCIAVDPWFIINSTPELARLISSARFVNDSKPLWVIEQIKSELADFLQQHPEKTEKDVTIACFGLSFKADIDDLRESPALEITKQIALSHPGPILAIEPNIEELPIELRKIAELSSMENAFAEADIILILVDHREFKQRVDDFYKTPRVIDTRGLLSA